MLMGQKIEHSPNYSLLSKIYNSISSLVFEQIYFIFERHFWYVNWGLFFEFLLKNVYTTFSNLKRYPKFFF